ncbi:HNH endonuclease-domain-containing protein [Tuber indicum]|nr:HNH endonuclease-domain-containing protein [Tuber indicum]
MPLNRFLSRNVFFYDATRLGVALGGLVQNGSITEANFLDILSTIEVSDEPWVHRQISHSTSGREGRFCLEIRHRDRKCVISGTPNPEHRIQANNWFSFEAAHIFPLQHGGYWTQHNYGRWITDVDDTIGSSINSIQNGFLLRRDVHQMFDQYLISVNPDDGYKVVVFDLDLDGYDGRILDLVCRSPGDPHRVSDQLLRWHFRQSVLANMRGAGELIFEDGFPPGNDMEGDILAGPELGGGFGMGIADRLREVS